MHITINPEEAKIIIAALLFSSSVNVLHAVPTEENSKKMELTAFHLARELHKKAGFPELGEYIQLMNLGDSDFNESHYRELFDYFSTFVPTASLNDV